MKKLLLAGAALAVCVPAQNRLGTFDNTGTTYASRGGVTQGNTNAVTLFVRIDKDRYAGWTTGATPGTRDFSGLNFVVQDENLASQETFNLVAYGESATQANFPAVANALSLTGNFVLPIGAGAGAYNASANFATAISVPATSDVFVGLRLNAGWTFTNGVPTNGLSVWDIRSATTPAGPQVDVPGRGRPLAPFDEGTFGGYYVPSPLTGPAYLTNVAVMFKIQPIVPIAGGVATARTNQTQFHVESTATSVAGFTVQAPGAGTACMLSGLFPDAASPPLNAGRVDEIGMIYINTATDVPPGSPVFFLIDLGTFSTETQLSGFIPGSTGVTCLSLVTMQTLALGFMGTGICSHVATFPPAGRALLTGTSWMQQAVGFNTTTNAAHAGPCTRQQM
jgi:hypothetical protein